MISKGMVYLVGGGPGDPELLTLKGLLCLQECDVVIYDALVNFDLLKHCRDDAEKIFVGKRRHRHSLEQSEINILVLKHARAGKKVCRLKGGDPFLFGRGGEEAEFLYENGIAFEVIPGVSSIIGVPAAAGIPLTHRDYASHVTVVTGQNTGMELESSKDRWEPYHYLNKKTMVILMGFANTQQILKRLIALGWPPDMPVALICSGTHSNQAVVTGILSDFGDRVERLKGILSAPAMIIVGKVVKLRDKAPSSGYEIDLLPLSHLKPHEEAIPGKVTKLKDDIIRSGTVSTPVWVEKENYVVLNGHHRLEALKQLGCFFCPVFLMDYGSPYIKVQVCPGSSVSKIDKESILHAALSGRLYPPRSSLHVLDFPPNDFPTPIKALKKEPQERVLAGRT